MAKECIQSCPVIFECISSNKINTYIMPAGIGAGALDKLIDLAERSYDCPGPEITEIEVAKGIFRRRTEIEHQFTCRHPEDLEQ